MQERTHLWITEVLKHNAPAPSTHAASFLQIAELLKNNNAECGKIGKFEADLIQAAHDGQVDVACGVWAQKVHCIEHTQKYRHARAHARAYARTHTTGDVEAARELLQHVDPNCADYDQRCSCVEERLGGTGEQGGR